MRLYVGGLSVGGYLTDPAVITEPHTPTETGELLLIDATLGGVTISLPDATDKAGFKVTVKKIDATVNTVTIDPFESQTIDGSATKTISTQWQSLDFISNGTNWNLV